ncbi:MAG TPA: aryl-sulfate sulfotransferase [Terracidiphilus sp.]|nr:aryl-sulfate sulfotransferase [Terracidiphilus sp.]
MRFQQSKTFRLRSLPDDATRRHLRRCTGVLFLASSLTLTGCGYWVTPGAINPSKPPTSGPPTAGQSGSVTIAPRYAAIAPGQKQQFKATATGGGQIAWLVNGVAGGNATVGTVDSSGNYVAPATISQSENVTITAELIASPQQNYATAVAAIIQPGQTLCPYLTGNPQVAFYSVYLPSPGKAFVQFGKTTDYGRDTWQVSTSSPTGGAVQIYVAGMLGKTLYHMRGLVTLSNGATFADADQTCTTGTPPATSPIKISSASGGTPQPGIELWNTLIPPHVAQAWASDLDGNVIWTYTLNAPSLDYIQGYQLLPDGDMLMLVSYLSSINVVGNPNLFDEVREVNLAGATVRTLTIDSLNQKLAASSLRDTHGNSYQLGSFHHSVLVLPNGHWVVLATEKELFTGLQGTKGPTNVIGDALVDVDQNMNPDWAWNTFDHLDINRRPMNFPDWTHSNYVTYSSDDRNLLLSIRHQNWIIKIEFLDGQGSGKVMWRLGEGGDFKLVGGVDPTDWFYAQHGMNYFTPNTTGVFRLGLMDNGNDRIFPSGAVYCKPYAPASPKCYSTMPVLEVNENNRTATLVTHYVPPPSYFSFFGGDAEQEANGDIQVDFCSPLSGAVVQELSPDASKVVWQAVTPGADQFHAHRLPSLYPGVQW